MPIRCEYLQTMRKRYARAKSKAEKSMLIDELVANLNYHRKHAIQVLNDRGPDERQTAKRNRPLMYTQALPAAQLVWEALDYPCAERLHPVLLSTAERLATHGELVLTPEVRAALANISRPTLSRRMRQWSSPKAKRTFIRHKPGLNAEVPVDRYAWDEARTGALEIDLVEHNGGSSLGHFAYTLSMTDVVSGYSRRRAILGRGQAAVFGALSLILAELPFAYWALHTDNGSEFLNGHMVKFAKQNKLFFHRSRPYKKNDNPHVEQKNRQYVREVVGYARYDTPEDVEWLNQVYSVLDVYANLFLPMRKVIEKRYEGSRLKKKFDKARTPYQRLKEAGALIKHAELLLSEQLATLNPLQLHRELERLLAQGPSLPFTRDA